MQTLTRILVVVVLLAPCSAVGDAFESLNACFRALYDSPIGISTNPRGGTRFLSMRSYRGTVLLLSTTNVGPNSVPTLYAFNTEGAQRALVRGTGERDYQNPGRGRYCVGVQTRDPARRWQTEISVRRAAPTSRERGADPRASNDRSWFTSRISDEGSCPLTQSAILDGSDANESYFQVWADRLSQAIQHFDPRNPLPNVRLSGLRQMLSDGSLAACERLDGPFAGVATALRGAFERTQQYLARTAGPDPASKGRAVGEAKGVAAPADQ